MTTREELQGGTEGAWPPAIECATRSVSALAPDVELRRGHLALLLALTGFGVPALALGIVLVILQEGWLRSASMDGLFLSLFAPLDVLWPLGLICEVVAAVVGTIARRTRAGRWGQAISMLVLGACFVYALSFIPARPQQ